AANRDVATSVVDTIEITTESGVAADQGADMFGGSVPMAADAPVESDVPVAADAPVEGDIPPAAE
ncbi:hypothetical protein ACFL3P_04335, partial [Pseudomonadota bacterium]